ncbi:hypothetical protein M011DRAFT_305346 [Sporormia fimetaria CBS 119925]|uniref:N-alpha-acetyltransferase 40 n=1 Tax=Sporormia fimetaria CBS 119925 TaxID=1340428 RepID=A0A6A6VIJ0_9PLEO|nr:hypothetical protein M011DRAFT_305346 [Sporormia fimetaria CBS 119925]
MPASRTSEDFYGLRLVESGHFLRVLDSPLLLLESRQRWLWVSLCQPLQKPGLSWVLRDLIQDICKWEGSDLNDGFSPYEQVAELNRILAVFMCVEQAFRAIAQDPWQTSLRPVPEAPLDKFSALLKKALRTQNREWMVFEDEPQTWVKPVISRDSSTWREEFFEGSSELLDYDDGKWCHLFRYVQYYLDMFRMGESDRLFEELAQDRMTVNIFLRAAQIQAEEYREESFSIGGPGHVTPFIGEIDDDVVLELPDPEECEKHGFDPAKTRSIFENAIIAFRKGQQQRDTFAAMWVDECEALREYNPDHDYADLHDSNMQYLVLGYRVEQFWRLNPIPHAFPGCFSLRRSNELGPERKQALLKLIEKTSRDAYEASSLGWDVDQKNREVNDPLMWTVLFHIESPDFDPRRPDPQSIRAFLSFKIDVDEPPYDNYPIGFIYEVHVDESMRGKGIGSFLLTQAEMIIRSTGIQKVMLSVFKSNEGGRRLYERMGYTRDRSSPGRWTRRGFQEADYVFMSKNVESLFSKPPYVS